MARIIMKSPYLKPNSGGGKHRGNYAKYIATREGVEMAEDTTKHLHATVKQEALIRQLLKDFPDSTNFHEYGDYKRSPTRENATELISRVMETHGGDLADREKYVSYIAERPGVEKLGKHGLFTDEGVPIVLEQVAREMAESKSNIWTHIISLHREDAARLGYDSAEDWMNLLRSKRNLIAQQMRIKPENFRWYAAFHDAGHHPHVHMMAYSIDPKEAYLTEKGIETIKGELAKEIFRQDHISIYQKQTQYRDQLREQGRESVAEIVEQIRSGTYSNSRVEELLVTLSDRLSRTSGKKVYGYLKADVKAIVDQIVAELAADERIQKLYNLWYEQREDVLRTYTDHFPERVSLEQNKEFKTIRNAVIQEAMKITSQTEHAALLPEQEATEPNDLQYWLERAGVSAVRSSDDRDELTMEAERIAAEQVSTVSRKTNKKAYYKNEKEEIKKAISRLQRAAGDGDSFAEYLLGRIYYFGNGVRVDREKGLEYLKASAAHGNQYAANLLNAIQYQHTYGVAQCAASLITQLRRIFQEQEQKQSQRQQPRMDRKHRREIEEKKQAMGIRD